MDVPTDCTNTACSVCVCVCVCVYVVMIPPVITPTLGWFYKNSVCMT